VVVLSGGEPDPRFAVREALDQLGEIAADSFHRNQNELTATSTSPHGCLADFRGLALDGFGVLAQRGERV
jgi:hypothetical protein